MCVRVWSSAANISLLEVRGAANRLTCTGQPRPTKHCQAQMSTAPRQRDPAPLQTLKWLYISALTMASKALTLT